MMNESCCFSMAELPCLTDHQLEGTPFVPMALLIDQLARQIGSSTQRLADIRVNMPVMLRKNRAKTLLCHRDGNSASLLDDSGNTYAALTGAAADIINNQTAPEPLLITVEAPAVISLGRNQIYPALMFHGPTFQADFKFYEFNPQTALVGLNSCKPDNPSLGRYRTDQHIPIVLTDLAFQVAGLHLMAFQGVYALPAACAAMTTETVDPVDQALLKITSDGNGNYQLLCTSITGSLIFTCAGLHFQNTARSVEPDRKNFLEAIKI